MPEYLIREATIDDAIAIIPNIREADLDEVTAATGLPIRQVMIDCVRFSTHAWVGLADGEYVCIFGVSPVNILAGQGAPWMIGTHGVELHQFAFLRRCRWCVRIMKGIYNHLSNYVDVRNERAIEWLKWLGATFDEPAPHGAQGLPFMRFEMGSRDV